jgi:hypothetical protein
MAMVFTRTLASNPTFPGNLVPVKLQAPFSMVIINTTKTTFIGNLTFSRLNKVVE